MNIVSLYLVQWRQFVGLPMGTTSLDASCTESAKFRCCATCSYHARAWKYIPTKSGPISFLNIVPLILQSFIIHFERRSAGWFRLQGMISWWSGVPWYEVKVTNAQSLSVRATSWWTADLKGFESHICPVPFLFLMVQARSGLAAAECQGVREVLWA